jgi:hypothetical protein
MNLLQSLKNAVNRLLGRRQAPIKEKPMRYVREPEPTKEPEPTIQPVIWQRYGAYFVWYGAAYSVKAEVKINYWVKEGDEPTKQEREEWLAKAVKLAFEQEHPKEGLKGYQKTLMADPARVLADRYSKAKIEAGKLSDGLPSLDTHKADGSPETFYKVSEAETGEVLEEETPDEPDKISWTYQKFDEQETSGEFDK